MAVKAVKEILEIFLAHSLEWVVEDKKNKEPKK